MDERDLETLHQEASAHYLQGEYAAALACWRQVLQALPGDGRALEGVRLCEQLVGTTSAPETSDPDPEGSESFGDLADDEVDDDPGGISEGMRESLSAVDRLLVMDERGSGTGGVPTTDGNLAEAPRPSRPPVAESQPADEAAWHWDGGSETSRNEDPVEIELRRRVNELMAEALVAMEQGGLEDALETLDRLLILDDANEPALTLQDRIRRRLGDEPDASPTPGIAAFHVEIEPEAQSEPTPGSEDVVDEPFGSILEHPDADDPFDPGPAEAAGSLQLEAPVPIDPTEPDLLDEVNDPSPADCEPGPDEGRESAGVVVPTARVAPAKRRLPMPVLLVLGVVLLAALVLAGRSYFGPGGAEEPLAGATVGGEGRAGDGPAQASVTPSLPATGGPAVDPATVDKGPAESGPVAEIRAAVAEGDAAFEQGDYSAAVVAYDRASKLDPENMTIRDRLQLAGEEYRKHQAHERQWQQAIRSFEEHDYHTALHTLYRLPADRKVERLTRIKENGWYNYGLIALRAGQCHEASSRFTEARSVQGGDTGIDDALRLARACRSRSSEFYAEMGRLEFRGLND